MLTCFFDGRKIVCSLDFTDLRDFSDGGCDECNSFVVFYEYLVWFLLPSFSFGILTDCGFCESHDDCDLEVLESVFFLEFLSYLCANVREDVEYLYLLGL